MTYQICKRCGRMFEKNGKIYCKSCSEKNERDFDLIINYIRIHPDATVLDVITDTGVSLKSINCLVEDGGISYIENKIKVENENFIINDQTLKTRNKFHIVK